MAIMQGAGDVFWAALAIFLLIVSAVATWYLTVIGRDRPRPQQKRGESTIAHYADLEEDRAPMPKFLTYTIVLSIIWAIAYALWTGINGLG